MATIAPPQLVQGVPRSPLPAGLFSLLAPRAGSGDRWENGVIWETLTCQPAGGRGADDCDPEADIIGLPKELDPMDAEDGAATPFAVYGHHTCTPIGNTQERASALAEQHLLNREEARVEQALWTGDLGNVPNFAGANGYAAIDNVGTYSNVWRAVARLEQEIAERYGSKGVLHMSREVATIAAKEGDLRFSGGRILTPLETPVVAGAGYSSDKIVATPPLFGYRSEIITGSNRPYDLLDIRQNNLTALAERMYLLGFDPCGAASVSLSITPEEGA